MQWDTRLLGAGCAVVVLGHQHEALGHVVILHRAHVVVHLQIAGCEGHAALVGASPLGFLLAWAAQQGPRTQGSTRQLMAQTGPQWSSWWRLDAGTVCASVRDWTVG